MRFSGHETFPIREGWLHKGLTLLVQDPEALVGPDAVDNLGVGQNMVRSIRHWLQVTGLAQWSKDFTGSRTMIPSEIGSLIHKKDPYFLEPGTLWLLHANLVSRAEVGTWYWFFNFFNLTRFERDVCLENLRQYLRLSLTTKQPGRVTLERDLNCLLASYSQLIPSRQEDPEEEPYCPLVELDLIRHYRASGHYEINREIKPIPFELMGYSLATAFTDAAQGKGRVDIRLEDAQRQVGAPGRVFTLSPEALFDTVLAAESEGLKEEIQISGLAGERAIRVVCRSPYEWLKHYYSRMEKGVKNAA